MELPFTEMGKTAGERGMAVGEGGQHKFGFEQITLETIKYLAKKLKRQPGEPQAGGRNWELTAFKCHLSHLDRR
jgi:hypothetical protein